MFNAGILAGIEIPSLPIQALDGIVDEYVMSEIVVRNRWRHAGKAVFELRMR